MCAPVDRTLRSGRVCAGVGTLAAKAAPTGVVEEGERVLVGGVVVRKKEFSA